MQSAATAKSTIQMSLFDRGTSPGDRSLAWPGVGTDRWRFGWRWYALGLGVPLSVALGAVLFDVLLVATSTALVQLSR